MHLQEGDDATGTSPAAIPELQSNKLDSCRFEAVQRCSADVNASSCPALSVGSQPLDPRHFIRLQPEIERLEIGPHVLRVGGSR